MALEIGIGIGLGAVIGATYVDNPQIGASIGVAVGAVGFLKKAEVRRRCAAAELAPLHVAILKAPRWVQGSASDFFSAPTALFKADDQQNTRKQS